MIASAVAISPPQQPWAIDEALAAADTWKNSASTTQIMAKHFERISALDASPAHTGLRDVKRLLPGLSLAL